MKNIYFIILARSHNDACAIAEAHKLAKVGGPEYGSVEVRTCGTKKLIAHVFSDGAVGLAGEVNDAPDFDASRVERHAFDDLDAKENAADAVKPMK